MFQSLLQPSAREILEAIRALFLQVGGYECLSRAGFNILLHFADTLALVFRAIGCRIYDCAGQQ